MRIAGGRTLVSYGLANSIVLVLSHIPRTAAQSRLPTKPVRVKLLLPGAEAPVPSRGVRDVDVGPDSDDVDELEDELAGDDEAVVSRLILLILLS